MHPSSILAIILLIVVVMIMGASFMYFISDNNPLPSGVTNVLKGGKKTFYKFLN